MDIKFTLGVAFDSGTTCRERGEMGNVVGGPAALLNWLESQLGLQRPVGNFTRRAIAYRACLKDSDHSEQFFHESFSVDPLGVAKMLLEWRDAWYLAGWDGGNLGSEDTRIGALSELENIAKDAVPPGEGQRVAAVIDRLAFCDLDCSVTTLDPIESYPRCWQVLLEKLGAIVKKPEYELADSRTDLGRIQRALTTEAPGDTFTLNGDDSVVVISAPSRTLSAEWFAQAYPYLCEQGDDRSIGLLVEGDGSALDSALESRRLPTLSVSGYSSARPILQVLSLAMEMLWAPLDPSRLLEFLAHPVGPVPRQLRRRLAEVVADQPGMGGAAWKAVIEDALKREEESAESERDAKTRKEKLASTVSIWLESETFPPYPGAPLQVVKDRISAIHDWMRQRIAQMNANSDELGELAIYHRAASQIEELMSAVSELSAQGESSVDADSFRRLIHAVRSEGSRRPDVAAQMSSSFTPILVTSEPGASVSPLDTFIWFGADHASAIRRYPWSKSELSALRDAGVLLQNLDEVAERQADAWLRPILSATSQLIMIVHDNAESHHPVFDRLRSVIAALPEVELLASMQGDDNPLLNAYSRYESSELRRLPPRERCWKLDASSSIPRRKVESFSSLESFVYGPYIWVLNYAARIREGRILTVNDQNMLKGTLAHQLFEDYFSRYPDIDESDIGIAKKWAEERIRLLLPEQGAVLLRAGRAPERERFISDTIAALGNLLKHLKSARVVQVEMESALDGRFVGGSLGGRLDLLARKADGREAIVDIKWGGTKYRQEALEQSKYLQLAVYSQLHRQSGGGIPAVGYFTITQSEMLILNDDFFPDAKVIRPKNDETLQEFWARFEQSWKQRRAQLDKGMVEVNVTGTEPIPELIFDDKALPSEAVFESYSKEFNALLGWEAEA